MRYLIVLSISLILAFSCKPAKKHETRKATDANNYQYEYVTEDPLNARIYTLDNGLKIFLSKSEEKPRISTFIGFNTGGANDPENTTGLAHYLEHLLFKGTSQIGTLDWESEKPLLDTIEVMFEHYRTLTDSIERKAYYALIDSVSQEASKFTVPNEYDKLMSTLGADMTNAYTSKDQTVYMNDIPSNELERWLKVEQYRYREFVPRLFHTELETVYEEKNRALDNDYRKVSEALNRLLWPNHPYGTQSVLGEEEHLKNPSITNIKEYFDNFYVPNNAVICMSGDFDYDKTVKLIDEYFGDWEPGEINRPEHPVEAPITEVKTAEVIGPDREFLRIGFRLPGGADSLMLKARLADMILNNREVGLIDLNLIQEQKVLGAGSYISKNKDYSAFTMYGNAKEGQSLEEVEMLLLAQLDSLKQGRFDDDLIEAIVVNLEISELRSRDWGFSRASSYLSHFNYGTPWIDEVTQYERMRAITKEDIMNFAVEHFGDDNYAVVYKRTGEDTEVVQIEKPTITEIEINRDTNSAFYYKIAEMKPDRIEPVFIDYENDFEKTQLGSKIPLHYVHNDENDLFRMYYLLDMGSYSDLLLEPAVNYMEYLGTDSLSPEEFKKAMYKLGASFSVYPGSRTTYITLSGIAENFKPSLELFEHLLARVEPEEKALEELVKDILKERDDAKKSKWTISRSLRNYAYYGEDSPQRHILSQGELEALKGKQLTEKIRDLLNYEHRVLYYGPHDIKELSRVLESRHYIADDLKEPLPEKEFKHWKNDRDEVYWTHYDMVQVDLSITNINEPFDQDKLPYIRMYNEYFSGSMSSILFQEMRESKALAYSVWARYSTPYTPDDPFTFSAFIGTQADKLPEALGGMLDLTMHPPESEKSFENARDAVLSNIETQRITKSSILFNYETAQRMGYEYDIRKDVYEGAQSLSLGEIIEFQKDHIRDRNFRIVLMGDRDKIDFETLSEYGAVKELSLEQLMGY